MRFLLFTLLQKVATAYLNGVLCATYILPLLCPTLHFNCSYVRSDCQHADPSSVQLESDRLRSVES